MTNGFFSSYTPLPRHQNARAEAVNAIFDAVIVGFDGVPAAAATQQDRVTHCTDTGSANAYAIAPTYAIVSYVAGQHYSFVATNANTMASTVNVSSLGVKTIKRQDGTDLQSGDIASGQVVDLRYDGTYFQLMSVPSGTIAAAATSATAAAASATAAASSASAASTSASAASTSATAAAASAANFNVSTRQVLTSGSGATYTRPSGPAPRQLRVRMVGGGGGSGGSDNGPADSTNGGTGGTTSFNSINAVGGAGSTKGTTGVGNIAGAAGGAGGTGSASFRTSGSAGQGTQEGTGGSVGGSGGSSAFGGGGKQLVAGATNTGGGAGGAANGAATGSASPGGGGGEYVEIIINSPAATYTYTVGAGGAAGAIGTSGFAGLAGGSGVIIVDEYY